MVRRLWLSLLIGGAFVGALGLLGYEHVATPLPFWLLSPGLVVGAVTPGSGFDLKEDHAWSSLSTMVVYVVNVVLYGGFASLLLRHFRSK
jgi:hypothetical protein